MRLILAERVYNSIPRVLLRIDRKTPRVGFGGHLTTRLDRLFRGTFGTHER